MTPVLSSNIRNDKRLFNIQGFDLSSPPYTEVNVNSMHGGFKGSGLQFAEH